MTKKSTFWSLLLPILLSAAPDSVSATACLGGTYTTTASANSAFSGCTSFTTDVVLDLVADEPDLDAVSVTSYAQTSSIPVDSPREMTVLMPICSLLPSAMPQHDRADYQRSRRDGPRTLNGLLPSRDNVLDHDYLGSDVHGGRLAAGPHLDRLHRH